MNALYTHKHGYDFMVERSPPDTTGSLGFGGNGGDKRTVSSFAKVQAMLKHIVHYDVLASAGAARRLKLSSVGAAAEGRKKAKQH